MRNGLLLSAFFFYSIALQAQTPHTLYYPNGQKAIEGNWLYVSTAPIPLNYRDFMDQGHAYLEKLRKIVSIPGYQDYYGNFNAYLIQMHCDGPVSIWYPNGQMMEQLMFKNGVINGQFAAYYETGGKSMQGHMINGMPDGLWKTYHMNGQIYYTGHFSATTQEELEYRWTSLFTLKTNRYAFNERIEYIGEELDTLDNETAHVTRSVRDEFNNLVPIATSSKNGLFTFFNQNGSPKAEMEFINNIRTGTWNLYDDNRQLKLQLIYDRGRLLSMVENGRKRETPDQFVVRKNKEEEDARRASAGMPVSAVDGLWMQEVDKRTSFDEGPRFDGDVNKYISEHVDIPEGVRVKDIRGEYAIVFTVEQDGTLTNVRMAKGKNELLNNELISAVLAMPKWKPGRHNGKPVHMEAKINFRLDLTTGY